MKAIAEQSLASILVLSHSQEWLSKGQKASGKVKELLARIQENVLREAIELAPHLQASLEALLG